MSQWQHVKMYLLQVYGGPERSSKQKLINTKKTWQRSHTAVTLETHSPALQLKHGIKKRCRYCCFQAAYCLNPNSISLVLWAWSRFGSDPCRLDPGSRRGALHMESLENSSHRVQSERKKTQTDQTESSTALLCSALSVKVKSAGG